MRLRVGRPGPCLVGFRVAAPWGLNQVTSFADAGLVVPEYNEANNFDSVP